jgi:hypothetical protein
VVANNTSAVSAAFLLKIGFVMVHPFIKEKLNHLNLL